MISCEWSFCVILERASDLEYRIFSSFFLFLLLGLAEGWELEGGNKACLRGFGENSLHFLRLRSCMRHTPSHPLLSHLAFVIIIPGNRLEVGLLPCEYTLDLRVFFLLDVHCSSRTGEYW